MVRTATLLCALVAGACAARPAPLIVTDQPLEARAPERAPVVSTVAPRLVAYPGLDVSYVANAEGEVYNYRELFYTYFDGEWFYASRLRGPWKFIEMKYVPSDLFRVRGHLPPGLTSD